jgi:hypothetical protein
MDLKLAEMLVQVLEDEGIDVSLRESYSGRGMYGKDTAGVVLSEGDVTDILKAVINNASMFCEVQLGCKIDFPADPGFFDLIEIFTVGGLRQDSMGRGMIIY